MKYSTTQNIKFCMWDMHEFEGDGVMCPIYFKPRQLVRKKKEYYMNQNISRNNDIYYDDHYHKVASLNPSFHEIVESKIFYDDMFCSNECCLAFIESNTNNPKYKNSKQIFFNELYRRIKNTKNTSETDCLISNIRKSNDWKTIDKFGGFLSIEEFRRNDRIYEKVDSFYENDCIKNVYNELIVCN